ncbi:hypothetical protein KO481_09430 [Nocardia sp. NEAU-G5]|uniref:Glycine zipper domain-containing protein n=1 Tax=Nocardia albiluteola TaxID=2842303 RepID=A0ABS6AUN8_9NOCA|nr:hypothetical protein [Nocardia albiluteola]
MARRVVLPAVGALPLALVVGCSSTTNNQADHSSSAAVPTTAGTAPTEQSTAPSLPGTAITPPPDHEQQPTVVAPPTTSQPGVTPSIANSLYGGTVGPVQPGVTPSMPQPGVVAPNYVVPPDFRPIPEAEYTEPAPAVDWQDLHAPTAVKPVKPIAPPPRTLRLGNFTSPVPNSVPDNVLNTVNVTSANGEAALATDMNSVGISPSRSDKIAAGTAAGAALGAAVLGVPSAVVGGVVGGALGGVIGGTVGGAVLAVPTLGTSVAVAPVVGTVVGAAAGAAVAGIPAAVVGGVIGGIAGAAIGSAV